MAGFEEELLAIRVELEGARKAAEESRDLAAAQKEIGTSTTTAGKAAEKSSKSTGKLSKVYGALGKAVKYSVGLLGVGAVFALHSAVEKTEELGKTTSALSRNMGLSSEMASRWGAVAQAREIDSKALGMSLGTLGKRFVEAAHKGGTALTPFHQLGISQEEVAKGAHNSEEAILIAAKAFGKAEGGPKRQAAAMGLLGKGWSTVLPLMSEGTASLQEQLHWADEFGVTLKGKASEGLMEMVTAQRKSKVAILGLQVSLTRALQPAIEAGQEELQTFIKTLNDPNLSAAQKIDRISAQFEGLESKLFAIIDKAAPGIAEHAGQLGLDMAVALAHGFLNSNLAGKLAISLWLLKSFGGMDLVKATAKSVGIESGKAFDLGLAAGIIIGIPLLIATGLEALPDKTKEAMWLWGRNAGQNFVNALIKAINAGIDLINNGLNEANALSFLGVGAPQIGHVGEVNWDEQHVAGGRGRKAPPAPHGAAGEPTVNGPPGTHVGPHGEIVGGHRRPSPRRFNRRGLGAGSNERPIIVYTQIDGKTVAVTTTKAAEDAAALA